MRGVLQRFVRAHSGIAAIEFAVVAPLFIAFLGLMIDFAMAFNTRMKLCTAVAAAGQFAFAQAQAVDTNNAAALIASIKAVAESSTNLTPLPAVTVLINNAADGANANNYYCVSGYNPVTWSSTGTSSTGCGGSVSSGKFVTISMSATRSYIFLPSSIASKIAVLSDTAIVRLQ